MSSWELLPKGPSVLTDLLWRHVQDKWRFCRACKFEASEVFEQPGMPWFCLALSCVCWSRWGRLGPLFLLHLITLRHSYTEQLVQSAECFWALLGGGNINPCSITRPNIIPRSVINISTFLPLSPWWRISWMFFKRIKLPNPRVIILAVARTRISKAKINWYWNDCSWTRYLSFYFFFRLTSAGYLIWESPLNWIWSKIPAFQSLPQVTLPFSHVLLSPSPADV